MPAVAEFGRPGTSGGWQPDPRFKLAAAAVAALAATLAFVQLLNRPAAPEVFSPTLTLSLQSALRRHRYTVQTPRLSPHAGAVQPVTPVTVPPTELQPLTHDWQAEVQAAMEAQPGPVQPPPRTDTRSLQQALQNPLPPQTQQDGEAYQNAYGSTIIKSHGACGEARTVAVGPAPQGKAVVTAPITCPGEYKPTMGEELLGWAKKMQQKLAPSPP